MAIFLLSILLNQLFKVPLKAQEHKPFAYLNDHNALTYDIKFDIKLKTEQSEGEYKLAEVNFRDIYWSMKQMIAQHTVTGCNLKVGDLLASGTISSDEQQRTGSLID